MSQHVIFGCGIAFISVSVFFISVQHWHLAELGQCLASSTGAHGDADTGSSWLLLTALPIELGCPAPCSASAHRVTALAVQAAKPPLSSNVLS
jgi:hypothetical protein